MKQHSGKRRREASKCLPCPCASREQTCPCGRAVTAQRAGRELPPGATAVRGQGSGPLSQALATSPCCRGQMGAPVQWQTPSAWTSWTLALGSTNAQDPGRAFHEVACSQEERLDHSVWTFHAGFHVISRLSSMSLDTLPPRPSDPPNLVLFIL